MAYDRKIINDLDFQNVQKVKNAVDPTADQDYATKKYVDDNVSSGGAPADATYITQVAEAGLSAEQALSALSTGIVKVTTGTGVLSTATADTDYVKDIGVVTHAATGKTTPVDADEMPIADSAASNVLKKVTLTNLKAYLKAYFDTLYGGSGNVGLLAVFKQSSGTNQTTTSATQADVDATNAAVTFTAPASGNVLVRVTAEAQVSNAVQNAFFGLREGSTDIAGRTFVAQGNATFNSEHLICACFYLTGISAGSHTYKLAYSVNGGASFIVRQIGSSATSFPVTLEVWACP